MKCLDDCHTYQLQLVMDSPRYRIPIDELPISDDDKEWTIVDVIHFYEMRPDGTKIDGVTNEELIRVLIHRINYLNKVWMDGKFECKENTLAVAYLEEALVWLERRTAHRTARKVEGTHEA